VGAVEFNLAKVGSIRLLFWLVTLAELQASGHNKWHIPDRWSDGALMLR
jgi:hypothetical protein